MTDETQMKQKMEEKNESKKAGADVRNSENGKSRSEDLETSEESQLNNTAKVLAEITKQNELKLKILEKEEKLLARQETLRALGGGSPAGHQVKKSEADIKKEQAMEFFKGTQIADAIQRHG